MLIIDTIKKIQEIYFKDNQPWAIGYSGGKDSSAVLKLCFNALKAKKNAKKQVKVVYSDSGVDIPVFSKYVLRTLALFEKESNEGKLPFIINIVKPELKDRFFVKVIGRGYVPPTNKFRWCTDRLRINPLQKAIGRDQDKNLVLLGVRKNESVERNKTIQNYRKENSGFLKQKGIINSEIFSPIIDFSTEDVWGVIKDLKDPKSISYSDLFDIYKILRPINEINNSEVEKSKKTRFGCWVCTVIRKDRAMMKLIEHGHDNLKPLLSFRNWLIEIRDDPSYRSRNRKNGSIGKGPFNLKTRGIILEKLKMTEKLSGFLLLPKEEEKMIFKEWGRDLNDPNYKEI